MRFANSGFSDNNDMKLEDINDEYEDGDDPDDDGDNVQGWIRMTILMVILLMR